MFSLIKHFDLFSALLQGENRRFFCGLQCAFKEDLMVIANFEEYR